MHYHFFCLIRLRQVGGYSDKNTLQSKKLYQATQLIFLPFSTVYCFVSVFRRQHNFSPSRKSSFQTPFLHYFLSLHNPSRILLQLTSHIPERKLLKKPTTYSFTSFLLPSYHIHSSTPLPSNPSRKKRKLQAPLKYP